MPSVSGPQHRFMAMARSAKGRAKLRASGKTPPPVAVAKEFTHADKGRHFGQMRKKK
jgi:hypothetical protein